MILWCIKLLPSPHYIPMASNRFAALSPDFEAEEREREKKAKEAKAKKEAAQRAEEKNAEAPRRHDKTGDNEESEGGRGRRRGGRGRNFRGRGGERGRGRGRDFHSRGRGGYRSDTHPNEEYESINKSEPKESRPYKFTGKPNAKHPYDRRSGTGFGTEVPKDGKGPANWGDPRDWKNEERFTEEAMKEDNKELGGESPENKSKPEEKKAEQKPTPEPVVTYTEYKAMMAEKQKGLTTKKPEEQLSKDPKTAANLKPYTKEQFSNTSAAASKKKKREKETTEESKKVELGGFIEHPRRPPREFDNKHEHDLPHKESKKERQEPKVEAKPFVMKEEEFPSL